MRNTPGYLFALVTSVLLAACSFGNTSGTPSPDANHVPSCGDGICAASEVDSCPADCGTHAAPDAGTGTQAVCGDGTCDPGEDSNNCPADCGTGSGSGSGSLDCSDPTVLEACVECLFTNVCTGVDVNGCTTCLEGGGGMTGTCNMDFVCDIGEDITTCIDCEIAGDTFCDGNSPDGTCEADESNDTCPTDCP